MAIKTDEDILETMIYIAINQHCITYMNQDVPINLTTIYRKILTDLEYEPNLAMREVASKMEQDEMQIAIKKGKLEEWALKEKTDWNQVITRMMRAIKSRTGWQD